MSSKKLNWQGPTVGQSEEYLNAAQTVINVARTVIDTRKESRGSILIPDYGEGVDTELLEAIMSFVKARYESKNDIKVSGWTQDIAKAERGGLEIRWEPRK